jgi:Lipase (class 3)
MTTNEAPPSTSMAPPIYEEFNLKTEEPSSQAPGAATEQAAAAATVKPPARKPRKGRLYGKKYSLEPAGIKVDDMIYGLKMAHLSCTDDSEGRLAKSGANTIKALEEIVGVEDARKPLSTLLKDHFDLNMDCWINESGFWNMRAVDTQGFIASNESTIVLSYRFSTSAFDWMTNLDMSSSEWEPDRDEVIGHAGWCSCLDGVYTKYFTDHGKPRVHTGFYNNFIYTIPHIRKHILEPLLKSDAKPKKVYICGCSLGAALATVAYFFVLQEMMPSLENPDFVDHKLYSVTAGSPRVCDPQMRDEVMDKVRRLRPLDRAVICRLVFDQDLVPHIPFHISGFVHVDKLVFITANGDVIINPRLSKSKNFAEMVTVWNSFKTKVDDKTKKLVEATAPKKATGSAKMEDTAEGEKSAFEIECETTPVPIKCHMPYFYLTHLEHLKEREEADLV